MLMILSLTLLSAEIDNYYPPSLKSRLQNGELANVLLLGIDARPGEVRARSDTIIFASYNPLLKKVILISIPRDTWVNASGRSGKINMLSQLQGPRATCQAVENLLQVKVDHYIVTNFEGFRNIIDIMGGVYLDVDINLSSPSSNIYLKKGYHCLNGAQALKYARYRGLPDADIGRTKRQQKLMKAVMESLLSAETIPKIPQLIAEMKKNVNTNISMSDMIYMANSCKGINFDNVQSQTLPGYHFVDPHTGGSYWQVDRQIANSIVESLYEGHVYEVNLSAPSWK